MNTSNDEEPNKVNRLPTCGQGKVMVNMNCLIYSVQEFSGSENRLAIQWITMKVSSDGGNQ